MCVSVHCLHLILLLFSHLCSGPDGQLGYSWTVTFLENSKLTFSGSQLLFNYATPQLTGTSVNVNVRKLKSANGLVPIGGYFALTFRGMRTAYLACDSTARAVADSLRALDSIGDVAVTRTVAPDSNNGYTWSVTFLTELGALDLMLFDGADLTGTRVTFPLSLSPLPSQIQYPHSVSDHNSLFDVTSPSSFGLPHLAFFRNSFRVSGTAATGVVAHYQRGVAPPFNSLDPSRTLPLGMQSITDMTNPYLEIGNLNQGIAYYFRVAAINAAGFQGPFAFSPNLYAVPQLQLPSPPSLPALTVVGGSTMQVSFGASSAPGGADVNLYKVHTLSYTHSYTHSYIHSYTHSFIHSYTHSFIYSYKHHVHSHRTQHITLSYAM